MTSPSFIATTAIQPYTAVKSASAGQGSPATSASDTIVGISGPLVTPQGSKIEFQNGENGIFRLAANSTIWANNLVCPSATGKFEVAPADGEFIALSNAQKNGTFVAMKTVRMRSSSRVMNVFNPANASTPVVYPYRGVSITSPTGGGNFVFVSYAVNASVSSCEFDPDPNAPVVRICDNWGPVVGITDSSTYSISASEHALPGMKVNFQTYDTVQVHISDSVNAGDKLMRKFGANGSFSKYPVDPANITGYENLPYVAVALQSGSAGDIIWAFTGGSMRHRSF